MSWLNNRAVGYDRDHVRANSLSKGDVIDVEIDGIERQAVVLVVSKEPLQVADDESKDILERLRQAGEGDKISPNFDEVVHLEVAYLDGSMVKSRTSLHAEWEIVPKHK